MTGGNDLIIFNVVGDELVVSWHAVDVDFIPGFGMTAVSHSFAILVGPEERNCAIGLHLTKHVEGGIGALVLGYDPMFDADVLAEVIGWE